MLSPLWPLGDQAMPLRAPGRQWGHYIKKERGEWTGRQRKRARRGHAEERQKEALLSSLLPGL